MVRENQLGGWRGGRRGRKEGDVFRVTVNQSSLSSRRNKLVRSLEAFEGYEAIVQRLVDVAVTSVGLENVRRVLPPPTNTRQPTRNTDSKSALTTWA